MDLPWGSKLTAPFVTNVGIITSTGPHGPNAMTAEWTHMLSYSPGLIGVAVGHDKATAENIHATKEFGVNIASIAQASVASVAGSCSGKEYDKIGALKELGAKFYDAKKIKATMLEGAALNAECKLLREITLGDHILFVGEVLHATADGEPLAYHEGKYWILGKNVEKPNEKERLRISEIVEKHKKSLKYTE